MTRPVTLGLDARKWSDGGIGTYLRELAPRLPAAFPEADRRVAFVRPVSGHEVAAALPDWETVVVAAAEYSPREPFALARAARRARLDLLHCPHWVVPFAPPCPVVSTIHDATPLDPRFFPFPKRLVARFLLRRALRASAAVLTDSEAARALLIDRLGPIAERIVAVPLGAPAASPAIDRASARRRLPAELGPLPPRFLLALANPRPHKGLAVLLDALSLLPRPGEWGLVLLGNDAGRGDCAGALARLRGEWAAAVTILPQRPPDEVAALLAAADAVVCPSFAEGFGLPLLEAMASGTAVIASDIAAQREVGGDVPSWFPAGDATALAARLRDVLSLPTPELSRLEAGRRRAALFDWDETARRTAGAYREVLSGGAR